MLPLLAALTQSLPTNASSIPPLPIYHNLRACDLARFKAAMRKAPSPKGLPATPCGRADIPRTDLCALLATPPVEIPGQLMRNTRVHPNRYAALQAHVVKRGHIVEVGTLYVHLARWMIHKFEPSSLTVVDN